MQPPGRITRKARDLEADVVQLRAQGYTLEAIRQALAGAGVHVSILATSPFPHGKGLGMGGFLSSRSSEPVSRPTA